MSPQKSLRPRRRKATGGTPTVAVMAGRGAGFNMGTGWKHTPAKEPTAVGVLATNVQQAAYGYSGCAGLTADGHLLIWGQNIGGGWPSSIGPEKPWAAQWGYRTGLAAQKTMEEVEHLSPAAIEAKERALEFSPRAVDGRKGVLGQLVYSVDQVVSDEGVSYYALVENCAKKPKDHPEAWKETSPQIPLFEHIGKGGTTVFTPHRGNIVAPIKAPQASFVKAVAASGGHMLWLHEDGSVRMTGHILRYGTGGAGFDGSYGPKPRPLLPPPSQINTFTGRLKAGSNIVDMLDSIQVRHSREAGSPPWSSGTTYAQGEHAQDGGLTYKSLQNSNTNHKPSSSPTWWELASAGYEASFGQATAEDSSVFAPVSYAFTLDESGAASKVIETAIANVEVTEVPSPCAVSIVASGPSKTKLDVTGGVAKSKVKVGVAINVLPAGTTLVVAETEMLHDSEGHEFSPPHERVVKMELSAAATHDFGPDSIRIRKPPKEAKFYPSAQDIRNSATWPTVPIFPIDPLTGQPVKAKAIATGSNGAYVFSLALTVHNEVLAWGSNANGQMGNGLTANKEKFQVTAQYVLNSAGSERLKNVSSIAAGEQFAMALNESHQIFVWGQVDKAIGGKKPDEENVGHANLPLLLEGVGTTAGTKPIAIAGSSSTGFYIREDGKVCGWGSNEKGECANGSSAKTNKQWKSGKAYVVGDRTYDRGRNYKCKANTSGSEHPESDGTHWEVEAGVPRVPTPTVIAGLSAVNFIAGGRGGVAAVTSGGDLKTWGDNSEGQVGNGEVTGDNEPVTSVFSVPLGGRRVLSVDCGEYNWVALVEGEEPAAPNLVKLKLLPRGEVAGEQSAILRIELDTELPATGWRFRFKRAGNWWEAQELQELIDELTEEINEEGVSGEEQKALEEEREAAEDAQDSLGGAVVTIDPLTMTKVGPKTLRYDWTPPGPLTPLLNYIVTELGRPESEPANWTQVRIELDSAWESPYVFG